MEGVEVSGLTLRLRWTGPQELTEELTVLQLQSLKLSLLGTDGDDGPLSHPVTFHHRPTPPWPTAPGPTTK